MPCEYDYANLDMDCLHVNSMDEIMRSMEPEPDIDLEELRKIVLEIDAEMERDGVPIAGRPMELRPRLSQRLGTWAVYETTTQKAAREILEGLYPRKDLAIPFTYTGAFLYRGVIYPLGIGLILGRVQLNPDAFITEISPIRFQELKSNPKEYGRYIDQCCDVCDFTLGYWDLGRNRIANEPAMARLRAALAHLQTASRTVPTNTSKDGALHSIFLAVEIMMKGALLVSGLSEREMRRLGHDLDALANALSNQYREMDSDALNRALEYLPVNVAERYENVGYSTEEAGLAIMAAQFIGGEVMRMLTNRNTRADLKLDERPIQIARSFP